MERPNFLVLGLEKLGACTQKDQPTIVKHPDAGAEYQCFSDIMRDEQSCLIEPTAQVEKLLLRRTRPCTS